MEYATRLTILLRNVTTAGELAVTDHCTGIILGFDHMVEILRNTKQYSLHVTLSTQSLNSSLHRMDISRRVAHSLLSLTYASLLN